ncbi:TIAF1 factor, partial [Crocuta crocuta]
LREQPFLCAAGETGERSWVRILKSAWGGALRCFWVWLEQACTDRGAYVPAGTFSPHPLRLISVLSAMTYLRLNPSHLRQSGAYPSTASLPLCPSCLDRGPTWRGKALQ